MIRLNNTKNNGDKNRIPTLVKKIKMLKLNSSKDILRVGYLVQVIFEEWVSLRKKCERQFIHHVKNKKQLYLEHGIQQELVIGLMCLLNEKIINFIYRLKNNGN